MHLPKGGYMGKVARVNLTSGVIVEEKMDIDTLRSFIGGTGIGAKILYDEVPSGVSPFDPQNRLIFATGPLNGTSAPGSGTYGVITKSPLTGLACTAQANGFLGARLKSAGYDTLILEEASKKAIYLYINNGKIEIKDGAGLAGKGTWDTESLLKKRYGNKVSVACIGPAGESLVRFAAIFSDQGHIAASGGVGAVMGSKKLKAIVVQGDMPVPIPDEAHDKLRELVREWIKRARKSPLGTKISAFGTAGLFSSYYSRGWLPVKNLTSNIFPEYSEFDGKYLREQVYKKVKSSSCYRCPLGHCRISQVMVGPYRGLVTEEAEYECLAGWGPNVGITDPGVAIKLSHTADDLGLDTKEGTFLFSLLMECYEKGVVSSKDMDNIKLSWGNEQGISSLLGKIAKREGVGDMLAEGVVRVAQQIGKEALSFAVYVKRRQAPHVHDLRTRWGTLFTQALSNTSSQEGYDLTANVDLDLGIKKPLSYPDEEVPKAQAKTGPRRQFEESLVVCYFLAKGQGSLKNITDTVNTVTGFDLSVDDSLQVGRRIINLLRVFNLRHGLTLEDDSFSPRLGMIPTDGPQAGKSMKDVFESLRKIYYKEMGWDEDTGVPLPQTLKELGLGHTINEVQRHKVRKKS